jgi:hypothetical protein
MITQSTGQFTEINKKAITELATFVEETLDFNICNQKPFTAADLWKIQRQKRTILQRRYVVQ